MARTPRLMAAAAAGRTSRFAAAKLCSQRHSAHVAHVHGAIARNRFTPRRGRRNRGNFARARLSQSNGVSPLIAP
jgi:hypothetical protein